MRRDTATRHDRYDAVVYEGIDPIRGEEKRRWYAAGSRKADTERMVTYSPTMRLIDGDRCRLGRSRRAALRTRPHYLERETGHGDRQGRHKVGAEVDG